MARLLSRFIGLISLTAALTYFMYDGARSFMNQSVQISSVGSTWENIPKSWLAWLQPVIERLGDVWHGDIQPYFLKQPPTEDLMRTVATSLAGVITAIAIGVAGTAQAQIPSINIEQTCRAAASAMVGMSGSTTEQDVKSCLESEQKAREQIIKDQATYSTADKKRCMRTGTYLPSYVEWLTCLEMERDVRKMKEAESAETDTMTLPRVRPKRLD